ncbi:MAG: class I SAM-dependent methyltransferase [Proteobacteria bacterium]|nr:class I SAM-dependent methyltransferase [Pseudomonadota bacterium]
MLEKSNFMVEYTADRALGDTNMDHINTGFRSILSYSFIYNFFQKVMVGSNKAMKKLVKEYVVPFPKARILDIGCGTSSVLEHLPESIDYTGYDSNPIYIKSSIKKHKNRGCFYCEHISKTTLRDKNSFDIVLAQSILHHLNDEDATKLFSTAFEALKVGGYLITFDSVYIPNQSKIVKFLIDKDRGQHTRTPERYVELADSVFLKVESAIRHDMYRIPMTIFIMKCTKTFSATQV